MLRNGTRWNIILSSCLVLCLTFDFKFIRGESKINSKSLIRNFPMPDIKYEITKRKIFQDIKEFLWYLELNFEKPSISPDINKILVNARDRNNAILSHMNDLSEYDGYKTWRENENRELSDLVQKRIHFVQNPQNCSNAKKLLCSLDGDCGFGCQFHRIVICLIIAYATERTLLLDSRDWSYSCDEGGKFEDIFQTISKNCLLHRDFDISNSKIVEWPGHKGAEIIRYSFVKHARPSFLPPTVPEDLIGRILRFHGDPVLWWISQFVKFLWKFQTKTSLMFKEMEKQADLTTVTVGIHIRRNDKILMKESKYYPIEEYMKYAKEYFDLVQLREKKKLPKRQMFVASDDSTVFDEIRNRFPDYKVLGDETRANSASLKSRYNIKSLLHLISDIHMLSLSDFIVCSLSSNVCKLAHEIQQQRFVDGSSRIHSLDSNWFQKAPNRHTQKAIFSHKANNNEELSFDVGDAIFNITNHVNGFSVGRTMKSNRSGIYPSYKTLPVIQKYRFPTYPLAILPKREYSNQNKMNAKKYDKIFENTCQKEKERCESYDSDRNGYIEQNELLEHFSSNDLIHKLSIKVAEDQDGKLTVKECQILIRTIGYRILST